MQPSATKKATNKLLEPTKTLSPFGQVMQKYLKDKDD
jgi:hypothetical protein